MDIEVNDAIAIGRDLLTHALLLVAPVVIVSLLVGVLISVAQTVTSIQEQTLTFAPRIVAVVAVIIYLTPWYLATLQSYTTALFQPIELLR